MSIPRSRSLLAAAVLLLLTTSVKQAAGQVTILTANSLATLEVALTNAATNLNSTTIRISQSTINISSPLYVDALTNVLTIESDGSGPVILHSTSRQDIFRIGWNATDGGGTVAPPSFIVRGLTFSGADDAIYAGVGGFLVENCTFFDNNVGFYCDFSRATIAFVNDTFTQNGGHCPDNFSCGGVRIDAHASSTAMNVTAAGNYAVGLYGIDRVQNSLIVSNGLSDCGYFVPPDTISASFDSDGTCGCLTTNVLVSALADNGGLNRTMALATNSPARDAGSNNASPPMDERGALRIDGQCDIGAFERSWAVQMRSATASGDLRLFASSGTFGNFHPLKENTLPSAAKPGGLVFPFGFVDCKIIDLTNGQCVTITNVFPSDVPFPPQYWQVDTNGSWTNLCLQLPYSVDANNLQITITDGGVGDLDGLADGTIRFRAGLGLPSSLPSVSIDDIAQMEGDSPTVTASFPVTLSAPSSLTLTVDFTTADETAEAGDDYVGQSGSVTFNPGQTTTNITITVIGDTLNETDETFVVNLTAAGIPLGKGQGRCTVLDDDPLPSLSIDDVSITEGPYGPAMAMFTVSLSTQSGQGVTVDFATADDLATVADNDYVSSSGTLTFTPGDTAPKQIFVQVNGDGRYESNETFLVNLSNPANASIAKGQGRGTILNDDVAQVVPPNSGPDSLVNTFTTGTQFQPALAMNASGYSVVAWASADQDGYGAGIFAQRYDPNGNRLGREFQVNTYTNEDQFDPAVAIDPAGNFVIAWTSSGQDGDAFGVFAQRFDANGTPQGTEFQVNTFSAGYQSGPAVAMDGAGNFIIAWEGPGDGSGLAIFAQHFDATGTPQDIQFRVNSYPTFDQGQPTVAMDAAGNFVIAWSSFSQDGSGYGIFAKRFRANTTFATEFQVNTAAHGDQNEPAIAMSPSGAFIIAWTKSGSGIFAQRFDPNGARRGTEFALNNTYWSQFHPAVAMDSHGNFVATWTSVYQDGSDWGVFARRFDSNGAGQGNEFQVSTLASGNQYSPSIGLDDAGNYLIAWAGASLTDYDIFLRRFFANTPEGDNVVVQPGDSTTGATPLTLTFSNVTQAGETMLTTSSVGPAAPTGFQLGDPAVYFSLSTSAIFTNATVCIDYSNISFAGTPQLLHYENSAWTNVTTSIDRANKIVCGSVTSFSPFALMELSCLPPTLRATVSGNNCNLTFEALSGCTYYLEYKTSLNEKDWIPLPPVAGAVGTVTVIDPILSGQNRFYRARVQ